MASSWPLAPPSSFTWLGRHARDWGVSVHGCCLVGPPSMADLEDSSGSGRRRRANAAVDLPQLVAGSLPSLGREGARSGAFPSLPWERR